MKLHGVLFLEILLHESIYLPQPRMSHEIWYLPPGIKPSLRKIILPKFS